MAQALKQARDVVVICHDVIGTRMAGPGIRYWEMARLLARSHRVTLLAPKPSDIQPMEFVCGAYTWGDEATLERWITPGTLVVANGFVLQGHPGLAVWDNLLALDLYDPTLLENIELLRPQPLETRAAHLQADAELLRRQLQAGDFFICATERQRDLYLGALMAVGAITPERIDHDPTLRSLIDVASFGLPEEPPVRQASLLRGAHAAIPPDAQIILWTGGLWDWLDPLSAIDAFALVAPNNPKARLVFLAGQHPGTIHQMQMPARAKVRAAEIGLLDTAIIFYEDWIPYAERANALLDADIAISLHRAHLETQFAAVRSRFLDHLWAELPSIVSAGDAAAELVAAHELGMVVPIDAIQALADAMHTLLNNPAQREQQRANIRAIASSWRWEETLAPLADWAANVHPPKARDQKEVVMEDPKPAEMQWQPRHLTRLNELISALEGSWRLDTPSHESSGPLGTGRALASQALRKTLGPITHQQTTFNTQIVHLAYWLSETMQQLQIESLDYQQQVSEALQHVTQLRYGEVHAASEALQKQAQILETINEVQTRLAAEQADFQKAQADLAAEQARLIAEQIELQEAQARLAAEQAALRGDQDRMRALLDQLNGRVGDEALNITLLAEHIHALEERRS